MTGNGRIIRKTDEGSLSRPMDNSQHRNLTTQPRMDTVDHTNQNPTIPNLASDLDFLDINVHSN